MSFIDNWKEWSKAKKAISIIAVCCIGLIIIGAIMGGLSPDKNTDSANADDATKSEPTSPLQLRITSDTSWSGSVLVGSSSTTYDGDGSQTIDLDGSPSDIVSACIQKQTTNGDLKVEILKNGKVVKEQSTSAEYGVVTVAN